MRINREKVLRQLAKKGWLYVDLCKKMGISRSTLSNDLGTNQPKNRRLETIYGYCNALNCKFEDIVDDLEKAENDDSNS